jgi:hypothetical protein
MGKKLDDLDKSNTQEFDDRMTVGVLMDALADFDRDAAVVFPYTLDGTELSDITLESIGVVTNDDRSAVGVIVTIYAD